MRVNHLIETGELDQEDLNRSKPFFDSNGLPSANLWALGMRGTLGDAESDPAYASFQKVLAALGLDSLQFDKLSTEPAEMQFFDQYDAIFELTEEQMEIDLPLFVTDPAEQNRLNAGLDGSSLGITETTRRLA